MNLPYVKEFDTDGTLLKPKYPILSKYPNRRTRRKKVKSAASMGGKLVLMPKLNEKTNRFEGIKKMKTSVQVIPPHPDLEAPEEKWITLDSGLRVPPMIVGKKVLHYH